MTQEGSKVVIVGGSSGIGFGPAEAIVERGADVILLGRSLDKLHCAARLLDAPQPVSTFSADVTVNRCAADVHAGRVFRLFSNPRRTSSGGADRINRPPEPPVEIALISTVSNFIFRYSTGLSPTFRTTRTASLKCFPAQHANANLGVALSTHFEKLRS
jgi:NAD(P)-dependent dehydrogenase (short-subunit alcohol dehydrogenase family)